MKNQTDNACRTGARDLPAPAPHRLAPLRAAPSVHPAACPAHGGARQGFSLMEVNIALLLVAVGLMGLLSLFPVGLRQSTLAASDTAQAAFADQVFNAMRANASTITNMNVWSNATQFAAAILPQDPNNPQRLEVSGTPDPDASMFAHLFL